jgi:hypothetical protein
MVTEKRDRRVTDTQLNARIAILENNQELMKDQHDKMLEILECMRKRLDGLVSEQTRFQGMIGEITIVLAGIATVTEIFGGFIRDHWK